MDLNAVRMLVQVVQSGSFSAAAQKSQTPLPTLSRRIRELERQLAVQLFERSTRGVRLTEAGARLYEYALRGVEILDDGEQAVVSDQANLRGRLRLSIPTAMDPWWEVLRAFQRRHPDIRLSVYATERRIDLIHDGIDVALRIGAVADESLVARRILDYRHVLVAAPSLLERLGEPHSPEELRRFPSAAWSGTIGGGAVWRLGGQVIEPQPIVTTNDYTHLRHLALSGDAITELPPFLASRYIEEKRLKALLAQHRFPEQTVNLLYPSHRHPSTLVRAYLDYCREAAAGYLL